MNLTEFFKTENINPTKWAKENGITQGSISKHMLWERGSKKGQPAGFKVACQIIKAAKGKIQMQDICPDIATEIEIIRKYETQSPNCL
jgi:hypothetical protein